MITGGSPFWDPLGGLGSLHCGMGSRIKSLKTWGSWTEDLVSMSVHASAVYLRIISEI